MSTIPFKYMTVWDVFLLIASDSILQCNIVLIILNRIHYQLSQATDILIAAFYVCLFSIPLWSLFFLTL